MSQKPFGGLQVLYLFVNCHKSLKPFELLNKKYINF